jgi:hypothetical protein
MAASRPASAFDHPQSRPDWHAAFTIEFLLDPVKSGSDAFIQPTKPIPGRRMVNVQIYLPIGELSHPDGQAVQLTAQCQKFLSIDMHRVTCRSAPRSGLRSSSFCVLQQGIES